MIKAVIIDDELLSIEKLKHVLEAFENVEVKGSFTEAGEALEKTALIAPQLIFLDIEMPDINGLELALRLAERVPDAEIVFVTAHEEYAVDAFEVAAFDYLLKPVTRERMAKTLERLKHYINSEIRAADDGGSSICCFGGFEVKSAAVEGHTVTFNSSKVRELFAYLVSQKGKQIKKEAIMDDLWPEMDYDKALVNLNTCIYQLRRMLVKAELDITVEYQSGCYIMKPGKVELDIDSFTELVNKSKESEKFGPEQIRSLIAVYRGGYLANEKYLWASQLHHKYYKQYKGTLLDFAAYCLQKGYYVTSEEIAEELILCDEFCEEAWEVLIETYVKKGTRALALKTFERYSQVLKEELGVEPGNRIKRLLDIR